MKRVAVIVALLVVLAAGVGVAVLKYVQRPERAAGWTVGEPMDFMGTGAAAYPVKLTSQVWQGITWKHNLHIVKPAQLEIPDTALLFITGSGEGKTELAIATILANTLRAVVAVLHDVPNQPLFGGLTEDDLIAHTFVKYLETKDKTWPCLFPMTKSAVKAMDAVQEVAKKKLGVQIERFVVSGASKRGWTTWFTGTLGDPRVAGIAPLVYDNLNLPAQMAHQLESFGTYSEQIEPYTRRGLPDMVKSEAGRELARIVDPYTYRDKITMPKMIIVGTNDRYWPLDASNLYWDGLVGEKFILHIPNAGHGLDDRARVLNTLVAFFLKIAGRTQFPNLSWSFAEAGDGLTLSVASTPAPQAVTIWVAGAPTKDFRDAKWEARAPRLSGGKYLYKLLRPSGGYGAMFAEAKYSAGRREYTLSTNVQIVGAK